MTQDIILQGKKLGNTDGLSVASQQHIETPRSKGQEKHAEESMCISIDKKMKSVSVVIVPPHAATETCMKDMDSLYTLLDTLSGGLH